MPAAPARIGRCAGMDAAEVYTRTGSPLGGIILAGRGDALTGLWFEGQKYECATLTGDARPGELAVFGEARRWLEEYFAGHMPERTPPLAPAGSPFRQAVLAELRGIPYGRTLTYGELARRLARGGSARAVGGAVGHNPISIMIPCHRVLGAGGRLTGYAGGPERKLFLLALEGVDTQALRRG